MTKPTAPAVPPAARLMSVRIYLPDVDHVATIYVPTSA